MKMGGNRLRIGGNRCEQGVFSMDVVSGKV